MVVAQHGIMASTRQRGIGTSEFTKFTRRMRLTSGSQGPRTHPILNQEHSFNQYKQLSDSSNNLIDQRAVSLTGQPCPYESTSSGQVVDSAAAEKVMDVFSPGSFALHSSHNKSMDSLFRELL